MDTVFPYPHVENKDTAISDVPVTVGEGEFCPPCMKKPTVPACEKDVLLISPPLLHQGTAPAVFRRERFLDEGGTESGSDTGRLFGQTKACDVQLRRRRCVYRI